MNVDRLAPNGGSQPSGTRRSTQVQRPPPGFGPVTGFSSHVSFPAGAAAALNWLPVNRKSSDLVQPRSDIHLVAEYQRFRHEHRTRHPLSIGGPPCGVRRPAQQVFGTSTHEQPVSTFPWKQIGRGCTRLAHGMVVLPNGIRASTGFPDRVCHFGFESVVTKRHPHAGHRPIGPNVYYRSVSAAYPKSAMTTPQLMLPPVR